MTKHIQSRKEICIGQKTIREDGPCFIIAEAGVNHNGELAPAKRLVDAAKKVGADAVKFQTWKTENIIVHGTNKAEYQKINGTDTDQFSMLKALELSYTDFLQLNEYAAKVGIVLFSTPDDEESMEFLVNQMHVPLLKIGSAELTNLLHLRKMASFRLPLIISTGMATLLEVRAAVHTIEETWPQPELAILHCTTAYPTSPDEANLRVLQTYQEEFPRYLIGFSDHTDGVLAAPLAVAMGAKIIEKHFTLDNAMSGPDHKASLNPSDFSRMVSDIRFAERMLGSATKNPTPAEVQNKKVVERFLVAARDIEEGEVLSAELITAKRTSEKGGLSTSQLAEVFMKKVRRAIRKDAVIQTNDVAS